MRPGPYVWRRAAVLTLVAAVLACAAAVSPAAAAAKRPPCTRKAIAAGLRRGTGKEPGAIIEDFQCVRGWAFAVDVYKHITVPGLLRAHGTRWVSVDRVKPCNEHKVPKKLYVEACRSS